MSDNIGSWITDAASLPLAFAQVREDPLLDRERIELLGRNVHVAMIASGGCTAALLAASPNIARLHLVDPNPAQLALTRVKIHLLQTAVPDERLNVLGHMPLSAAARQARLALQLEALGLPDDILGPPAIVAQHGADHAGRYERVFAALRLALNDQTNAIDSLLRLSDPTEQTRRTAPATPLGQRLDMALDEVMSLPNLVRLFGEEATKNPVEPFARHFARRIRHVLATLPAERNPYLWQMLKGCYPVGCPVPWLTVASPARVPHMSWSSTFMAEALAAEPAAFDFVHLSNILDWLSPEKAQATLELAASALRRGGWTFIRQLNSTLDIAGLGPMFDWQTAAANELHERDRSFFYRGLHLGRKR